MIAPPKFNKVLSTAHLTLITLSSLFALIIFVISLFTFAILPLGLNTAAAAVTILFHIIIIILSWRRSLNAQTILNSPTSLKGSSLPPTTLSLPATGASLTVTIFLFPLWIIALASQILDVIDPNSPNKTQANQSVQVATPQGRVLGTDDDEQSFAKMLSLALVVCEAVQAVIILGMVVYGINVRRTWRMEKEKAMMKSFMLNPWIPDQDLETNPPLRRQRSVRPSEPAPASTTMDNFKRMTKRFTQFIGSSNAGKRDLRVAPFPVRGEAYNEKAQEAADTLPPLPIFTSFTQHSASPAPSLPSVSVSVSASPLSTSSPQIPPSITSSRMSQTSHTSRISRLTNNLNIKNFKRPGRPWSYLTPGRASMINGETPIETAVEQHQSGGKAHPFKGHDHRYRESAHDDGVDSLYDLYEDEKEDQPPQPLQEPVTLTKLPNYIHREPTGPRAQVLPRSQNMDGTEGREMFGGVVKVKAPVPPKKAHTKSYTQAGRGL